MIWPARPTSVRILSSVLVLVVAAFPMITLSAAEHCVIPCGSHVERASAAKTCCAKHDEQPAAADHHRENCDDQSHDRGTAGGCSSCLSACCRAIDVHPLALALSYALPLIEASVQVVPHSASMGAGDAVFHPPRA